MNCDVSLPCAYGTTDGWESNTLQLFFCGSSDLRDAYAISMSA